LPSRPTNRGVAAASYDEHCKNRMSKKSPTALLPVPAEMIERRIYLIRGHKVMLDADLADLYQVATKVFNQAVKRNKARFPEDFMFRLTAEEAAALRSQTVTLTKGRGRYSKYAPFAFTEQGVAMLSAVLHSKRAVQTSIAIVRVFVKLRELLATHKELAHKMEELEREQKEQAAHIATIYQMVEQLMAPSEVPPSRRIGYIIDHE
jgi:phage regulator Rha-like protein